MERSTSECSHTAPWLGPAGRLGLGGLVVALAFALLQRPTEVVAQQQRVAGPAYEYAVIRWDGRDNTHIVRPDGTVLHLGAQLKELSKPSRTDERAFYMASVLNAVAREGYELVGMHPDEFVVRRPAQPAN